MALNRGPNSPGPLSDQPRLNVGSFRKSPIRFRARRTRPPSSSSRLSLKSRVPPSRSRPYTSQATVIGSPDGSRVPGSIRGPLRRVFRGGRPPFAAGGGRRGGEIRVAWDRPAHRGEAGPPNAGRDSTSSRLRRYLPGGAESWRTPFPPSRTADNGSGPPDVRHEEQARQRIGGEPGGGGSQRGWAGG